MKVTGPLVPLVKPEPAVPDSVSRVTEEARARLSEMKNRMQAVARNLLRDLKSIAKTGLKTKFSPFFAALRLWRGIENDLRLKRPSLFLTSSSARHSSGLDRSQWCSATN